MAPHLLESETDPEAPGKKRDACSSGVGSDCRGEHSE